MIQKSIDDVVDDLVSVWHDAQGMDGIELHQFLGFTEPEYGAWVGPDIESRVVPERLHGYLRWLHDRVWVGPGHEVRWAGRMMRELNTALDNGQMSDGAGSWIHMEWGALLAQVRALCWRHVERPDPGGPEDGHLFEVAVRHRGSYGFGPDFERMVYEDARDWTEFHVAYFRAWSLMAALTQAAELPFAVWMSHYEREEEPS